MAELSREALKLKKTQERKTETARQERDEKESFESACRELAAFVKDPRYKGYKYLLQTRIKMARVRHDNLRNTTKTNDDYLKQALILETEISVLREIIEIPNVFAARLDELKEDK